MYSFMYPAIAVPPTNNPVLDDHIFGALTTAMLIFLNAGVYLGIGSWWQAKDTVKKSRSWSDRSSLVCFALSVRNTVRCGHPESLCRHCEHEQRDDVRSCSDDLVGNDV